MYVKKYNKISKFYKIGFYVIENCVCETNLKFHYNILNLW